MPEKKTLPPFYVVDFVTALPPERCRERLERDDDPGKTARAAALPIQQRALVQPSGAFFVERSFPGALWPIRFSGQLDHDEESGGTWVHGAITQDAENQVWIEGLLVFLTFFLIAVLFYLRLRVRGLLITGPLLLLALTLLSVRWRALRETTRDLSAWVRRRLYLTAEQVRRLE